MTYQLIIYIVIFIENERKLMENKSKRKQMAFNIDIKLHQQIRIQAAKRNITMNLWIIRAIEEYLKKEIQFDKE